MWDSGTSNTWCWKDHWLPFMNNRRPYIPTYIADCLHIPWVNCDQINNLTLNLQLFLNHVRNLLQYVHLSSPANEGHSITCRIQTHVKLKYRATGIDNFCISADLCLPRQSHSQMTCMFYVRVLCPPKHKSEVLAFESTYLVTSWERLQPFSTDISVVLPI